MSIVKLHKHTEKKLRGKRGFVSAKLVIKLTRVKFYSIMLFTGALSSSDCLRFLALCFLTR